MFYSAQGDDVEQSPLKRFTCNHYLPIKKHKEAEFK